MPGGARIRVARPPERGRATQPSPIPIRSNPMVRPQPSESISSAHGTRQGMRATQAGARGRPIQRIAFGVAAAMVVLLPACSSSKSQAPKTVRVSGTVTMNGEPLPGADVYFITEQFTGYAKTNEQGRYELVQGAVSGSNRVHISKFELPPGVTSDPESGMDLGQFEAAALAATDPATGEVPRGVAAPRQLVPREYSDPANTKLTFPVPEDGTDSADFRL